MEREVFYNDDLLTELLIHMDIISIIYLSGSSKQMKHKIITLLRYIIPILLENVKYVDTELLILYLLENNKTKLAKQVLTLFRENNIKADEKISNVIYDKSFFKKFLRIAPDNFDWDYIANNINHFTLDQNGITKEIIKNILIPAIETKNAAVIQEFVNFWEHTGENYEGDDIYKKLNALIEKGKTIIKVLIKEGKYEAKY